MGGTPRCTRAAIANAPPFKTGVTAFTLGLGKIVAPMAFVYAPVLLIVSSTGFSLGEFLLAASTCIFGVVCLSAAVSGFMLARMNGLERVMFALAGLVLISPNLTANAIGLALVAPGIVRQIASRRSAAPATA